MITVGNGRSWEREKLSHSKDIRGKRHTRGENFEQNKREERTPSESVLLLREQADSGEQSAICADSTKNGSPFTGVRNFLISRG